MKKTDTNTAKHPVKRLIALWVVFVMLVVPFANHVGKNDVKAEGENGTTIVGENLAPDISVETGSYTLEWDSENEKLKDIKTDLSIDKTYMLYKDKQSVATIKIPICNGTDSLPNGKAVKFEFKLVQGEVTEEIKSSTGATIFSDGKDYTLEANKVKSDTKIAVYACVDNTDPDAIGVSPLPSILLSIIDVRFVESAFSGEDGIYNESEKLNNAVYTSSASLRAGVEVAKGNIKYMVTDNSVAEDELKNASNYEDSYDLSATTTLQTKYAYAAYIKDGKVLEYKTLGNIQILKDTQGPDIAFDSVLEKTGTGYSEINEQYEDGNVYYGISESYKYIVTIKDIAKSDEAASGVDENSLSARLDDGTPLDKPSAVSGQDDKYEIIVPSEKLSTSSPKKVTVTAKDKMGILTQCECLIQIQQVDTNYDKLEVAMNLEGQSVDLTNNQVTISTPNTVQVKYEFVGAGNISEVVIKDDQNREYLVTTNETETNKNRVTSWLLEYQVPIADTQDSITVNNWIISYKVGEVTKSLNISTKGILFDKTPPTISDPVLQEKLGNTGEWHNVTFAADDTYTTKLDGSYRYVVTVTDDENGSGVDDDSVKAGERQFKKDGSSDKYIYNIITSDYASGLFSLVVQASDKAGNTVQEGKTLPTLRKLDEEFRVDEKKVLASDKTTDITNQVTATATKYSNQQLYLELKLSSVYEIREVELHAKDGIYKTLEGTQISNTLDNDTHRYTAEVEFALPMDTNVNEMINHLYITAKDSATPERTLNYPGVAEGNQTFIGSILYDNTHPYATVSTIKDKWYQSYTLDYSIYSGTQTVESNLSKAEYSFNNCAEPTTVSLVQPGSELPIYTGSVDVPESSDPTGTLVQFAAEDMCLNNIDGTTAYRIKVDKHAPTIQFNVNGKTSFANPIEGNVAIATAVSDNLTIAKATITVTRPDGSSVVKELCSNVIGSQTISNNYTLDNLLGTKAADGAYTVTVNVADMSGRTNSQTITFKVDNTIPVVTAKISDGVTAGKQPGKNFDGTDCDYFYRSNVTALLTYEDDNLSQSKVVVKDNGTTVPVQWSRVGTTNKYQATYVATREGAHTITIGATDEAGNEAVTKQIVFIKDTAAPVITAVINGGMVYSENMGEVDLTANANLTFSVSDSNEDVKDFNYQLIKTEPDQLPVTADVLQTETRGFGYVDEADYMVKVYAIDKAGNKSAERTVRFRVDKTAPELKISGASSGSTLNSGTTLTFSMTEAFWKDASGTITITRKPKDGAQESTYKTIDFKPTARTTTMTETLSETGEYKVTFTGKDRAGHSAEAASYTVKIDTGKPVIVLSGVKNNDKTTDAVEFQAQIDEDFYLTKSVSIKATRTYLDKTSYQEKTEDLQITGYNPTAATTLIRNTFTEDGIYKIQIDCKDAAGNTDTQEVAFTIDKTKPVIDAKVLGAYAGKLTTFSWDYDLDDIVYDLTVCDVHMYLNGTEYDGTSEVEDGAYELKIVAEDELGNQTEETTNFSLDTKAPTFIVTGVEDGEVKNEQYDINVSLQLEEDTLDSVALNGKAVEIKDNAASITVTEKGDYKLTMKAHDEAGNEAEKTISFTYGEKKSVVLYVVIGVAALVVLGGGAALIIGLRKKKA